MTGFLIAILFVAVIVALARLASANKRLEVVEENVIWLRAEVAVITRKLKELSQQQPAQTAAPAEESAKAAADAAKPAATVTDTVPAPEPVVEPVREPIVEPLVQPLAPPTVIEQPRAAIDEPLRPAAFGATEPPPAAAAAETSEPQRTPPPARPPFAHTTVPPAGAPPARPFDWEGLVGVKLFSWIAGFALVLAAVFFLRYSVQQGWLSPVVRATIGVLAGTALIVGCELRVARAYVFTANALDGAGVAILYASLFATYALWHLLSPAVVFPLMIVVTAVAVLLSIRRNSLFIALLGLVGGFATPALLSTGENRPLGLFGYLLLLNIGLAAVGFRRRWPALTFFSMVLTALYEWGWIGKFLTPSQMPLAASIFLVFAGVAATALWAGRRADAEQTLFDRAALLGSAIPLLFGLYGAAVPEYGARYNLLFGFLLLMTAGLSAIAFSRGPQWLHELGAASTVIVLAVWLFRAWTPAAWPGVLAWVVVFIAGYLAVAVRFESYGVYAAPLLFFTFASFIALGAGKGAPLLIFATTFAMLAATSALAMWRNQGALYYLAAFFTIAAEAVWSARYLTADRLISGLAIYGVFALMFLGIPLIARRLGRPLEPSGALAVLVIVSIGTLLFLTGETVADSSLWGLAVLLGILNLGALTEARRSAQPLLAAIAMILSWIVLAVWWNEATVSAELVPALMVVGAFSVLVVIGNLWAAQQPTAKRSFENGVYLSLAGHVFLLFVVTQSALSIPPWPAFAILALLDLALAVAALYLRRARLLTMPLLASQAILLVWCLSATNGLWSRVTLIASIAVAMLGVVWYAIDRRFSEPAAAALLAAYVVAMVADSSSATPLFGSALAAYAIITVSLLVIAWVSELHILAVMAAVATGLATALADIGQPGRLFGFAFALYALPVAYAMLLGARAKRSIQPHLAAVIASAWFFFAARSAIIDAGYGYAIGVLPVAEAIVLMLLLLRLLRCESPSERLLSRLALVAGSALAFITAAVPLQLDKQWITISWALEGAALVWLYRRIPHRGLLLWAGGLLAVVFVRLTLNPAVLDYHPPSSVAILNWFLYTYLICSAAMYVSAKLAPHEPWQAIVALNSAGTILLFLLLNIEIADFYSRGPSLTFNFFSSSLAQDLTYTIGWAIFAMAMLVVGIVGASRPARIAAIVLLLVTILKCFLHDLPRLGGLYRVGSLLGLAASLVATGILLQKYVMTRPKQEASAP